MWDSVTIFMEMSASLKRSTALRTASSLAFTLFLVVYKDKPFAEIKKAAYLVVLLSLYPRQCNMGPCCALFVVLVLIICFPALSWMWIPLYTVLHYVLKTQCAFYFWCTILLCWWPISLLSPVYAQGCYGLWLLVAIGSYVMGLEPVWRFSDTSRSFWIPHSVSFPSLLHTVLCLEVLTSLLNWLCFLWSCSKPMQTCSTSRKSNLVEKTPNFHLLLLVS